MIITTHPLFSTRRAEFYFVHCSLMDDTTTHPTYEDCKKAILEARHKFPKNPARILGRQELDIQSGQVVLVYGHDQDHVGLLIASNHRELAISQKVADNQGVKTTAVTEEAALGNPFLCVRSRKKKK